MPITNAHAYLLACAARGDEANFDGFADGSDRIIEAAWIRGILLGNAPIAGDEAVALGSGALRIRGAHVRGELDLRRCGSAHQPLPTLCVTRCRFEEQTDESASIDLSDAHLGGLDLSDSQLTHLRGVGMRVDGSVDISRLRSLDDRPGASCQCKLSRAFISGHLLADDVHLCAPAPSDLEDPYDFFELNWALNLFMSHITGSVMIRKSPVIAGGLMLDSAHVHGDVLIDSATIRPRGLNFAVALERITIDGSLKVARLPQGGFRCDGPIWMHRATIGGSFDLAGASLKGSDRTDEKHFEVALYAGGVTVRGGVTLENVTADGLICLQHLHSHGMLRLQNVRITGTSRLPRWFPRPSWKDGPLALDARGATVATTLRLNGNVLLGRVDLSHAQCTTLDVELVSDRDAPRVAIDGLTYKHVAGSWFMERRFDDWLPPAGDEYHPQPYVQLADVLASHGQESDALDVLLVKAKCDARRHWYESHDHGRTKTDVQHTGVRAAITRIGIAALRRGVYATVILPYSWCFDFGLSPVKAGLTLLGSVVLGATMFWWMDHQGAMVVAQTPVAGFVQRDGRFVAARGDDATPAGIACNDAIRLPVYAADVFIPLVDLREEGKCDIDAVSGTPRPYPLELTAYRWLKAIYAIAGWIVTTLALLTFSGVMRHRLSQD